MNYIQYLLIRCGESGAEQAGVAELGVLRAPGEHGGGRGPEPGLLQRVVQPHEPGRWALAHRGPTGGVPHHRGEHHQQGRLLMKGYILLKSPSLLLSLCVCHHYFRSTLPATWDFEFDSIIQLFELCTLAMRPIRSLLKQIKDGKTSLTTSLSL